MFRAVDLPAMITLVPSRKLEGSLQRLAQDHPELPRGVGRVLSDLAGRRDGVPVIFREPREPQGDWSLGLHLSSYVVWLFQTRRQDAYTIAAISPLRLRDHDRLARGCLLVRAGWQMATDHRQIPQGGASHWQTLWYHWQKLTAQLGDVRDVPLLSPQHTQYLETLDRLIDATQKIADEKGESAATYPYRAVTSTGERRLGASPVYTFQVVGEELPDRGAFVQPVGEPGQRGHVVRVKDDQVTVQFDTSVTWERLSQQGQLEIATSNIVFEKQREAVRLLRDRQARNRTLLPALVDHHVLPIASVTELPGEDLDEDQLVSFRKALGSQDMMIVLGPPGTGKTRTISQIARSCALASDQGPVLVASHTNRAVDNVLAKLPRDVTVVRVGNVGQVTPEGRPFLLDRQAADLRTEITSRTGHALREYQHVDAAAEWTTELGRQLTELAGLAVRQRAAEVDLQRMRRAAGGSAQSVVDTAADVVDDHERRLSRREQRVGRLTRRRARAAGRTSWPLIGGMFSARVRSLDRHIAALISEIADVRAATATARKQLLDAEHALDEATRHIPEVQSARETLVTIVEQVDSCRAAAVRAADVCRSILITVDTPPPADDLAHLHEWLVARIPLLRIRGKLLQEWHDKVSEATEQLYPELIRYADVIGATCIGAASRPEISGVSFDLAIIDEAGQIGVANLLVPLVRAQRAVLVGDHRQLPPFVESELLRRPDAVEGEVRTLLTTSALEILVQVFPESHIKQLTQQRRMPAVIAEFISHAFYDGSLRTMVERVHYDPLFSSPFAFVDTSSLGRDERAERGTRGGGTDNPAEALLLSSLASFYHQRGTEWALIVPYAAQVKLIKENLRGLISDPDVIESNVGTVDAFQGGERDVVLYGFTRSNPGGQVGFLDELRRANVAFTRAKQQLVLVGDRRTLVRAQDAGFRTLATALWDYVREHGHVKQYREIMARLSGQERAS